MTERSMSVGRLVALGARRPGEANEAAAAAADLASPRDRRSALPEALSRLGLFSALLALVSAGAVIGTGYAVSDVLILIVIQLAVALAIWRIPWPSVSEGWLLAAIAVQLLFVTSLISLTGGALSPHYALYAPVLAIAGWHLRAAQVAVVIAMLVTTELWRALVIDPSQGLQQLAVAVPAFVLVAILAHLSSRQHAMSHARSRLDQLRIATTLHAIRAMGDDEHASRGSMAAAAADVFEAEAWIATPDDPRPADSHSCRHRGSDHAIIPIRSAGAAFGWLRLCRRQDFTNTERRLAAVLAETMGQAIQQHNTLAELRHDPRRDAATGRLSRAAFDADLVALVGRSSAFGEHVTLFLFQVLSAQRHWAEEEEGDAMLRRIGLAMRSQLTGDDRVYRYAPGVLAIVVRGADDRREIALAERLRTVTKEVIRRVEEAGGRKLALSFGISRGTIGSTDVDELIKEAERQLRVGDAAT